MLERSVSGAATGSMSRQVQAVQEMGVFFWKSACQVLRSEPPSQHGNAQVEQDEIIGQLSLSAPQLNSLPSCERFASRQSLTQCFVFAEGEPGLLMFPVGRDPSLVRGGTAGFRKGFSRKGKQNVQLGRITDGLLI